MAYLPFTLVLLLAAIAWNHGGYDPGALLALELGAAVVLLAVLFLDARAPREDEELTRARYRTFRHLPFFARHAELASLVRFLTLSRFPRRKSSLEVNIVIPASSGTGPIELDLSREGFLLGRPIRRTRLLMPLALLTGWIALSLVPLSRPLLAFFSPEAAILRGEVEGIAGEAPAAAPLSLAPYPSLRGLWLWLAVVGLGYLSIRSCRTKRGASRLGLGLVLLGAASGTLGALGFFSDVQSARGLTTESLRASGSFGNPNHYAGFQSMLLLSSLGFFLWLRERGATSRRGTGGAGANDSGLAAIAGIAILLLALGLLLSLSRAGIASAVFGIAVFTALTREPMRVAHHRRRRAIALLALAFAIGSVAVWVGVEPLLGRFGGLDDEWQKEASRIQVWRDSAPALSDYWLTGSGLGSFRYLGSRYRSFGGRIFYSWAHNDYLQLGIELGLPGLLLLAWLGAALVSRARAVRRDLAPSRSRIALHAGFASALAAMALHSLTDFGLHLPANLALFSVLAGAVAGMEQTGEKGR